MWERVGYHLMEAGFYRSSRLILSNIDTPYAKFIIGYSYLCDADAASSAPHFSEAMEDKGLLHRALFARATAYLMLEEHEKALSDIDEAIEITPSPKYHMRRMRICHELGQETEASKSADVARSHFGHYKAHLNKVHKKIRPVLAAELDLMRHKYREPLTTA